MSNHEANDASAPFIARWQNVAILPGASELATAQSFVNELCALLGVPTPHHAEDYQFERPITFQHGDGSTSPGRIDCYRRGAFVLEAKKLRPVSAPAFDAALLAARAQAEGYARALPASEGRPPFVIVVDVGRVIELYSEFSRSGGTYVPFPDPRSHRIALADLAKADVRERLRTVWLDPLSLDPARASARVTRAIAAQLAEVAKALEAVGHAPKRVAAFLSRCLFTMFAEDVGLLPKRALAELLQRHRDQPDVLGRLLVELWTAMDRGDFSATLATTVLKFNGKLFKSSEALPLAPDQIDRLLAAANADWKQVEPAIFGTLLERALDPDERHALGAHYTPRAYVERLVLPTIVEPLRDDWNHAQAAALVLMQEGKAEAARRAVRDYLQRLCEVRVLDPACGSGNFLYVALEQMKRLEGEVLNFLDELGDTQGRLELAGVSVDPHQLLGIELNPRAAEVAEMVLWIGYLQWHYRTRGNVNPPLPVLKDFHNIECRDAVLAYDRIEYETDESGRPVMRWDGRTMKPHPVTGLDVPDERAQVPVEKYVNPRAAQWPAADFVVGNPPFHGAAAMRGALGSSYVEALRTTLARVPESADFVMYWWNHAADLSKAKRVRRFGFITTNSLRQIFNRRVIEQHMAATHPLSIRFAIPDHPWVDRGAAVRVAMTAADHASEARVGELQTVVEERVETARAPDETAVEVRLSTAIGYIHPDLRIGANITAARALRSNSALAYRGVTLIGGGFWVQPDSDLLRKDPGALKPILNGHDITDRSRGMYVIDFFGLSAASAREQFPSAYQKLLHEVKPLRDQNPRFSYRNNWWLFAEARPDWRQASAGLSEYIATPMTAKHRMFVLLPLDVLPDQGLVPIASNDAFILGCLSSRLHVVWALAAGGRMGLGNDPRYNQTRCFHTFAFPQIEDRREGRIAGLGRGIDAHRKRQQSLHPDLTLTGLYNVLEKLRTGEPLSAKERKIHDDGLVSVLRELHDDLDRAVFDAYGWNDLAAELVGKPGATTPLAHKPAAQAAAEEELLARLVKLNAARAAEEARGLVRWLRPEYQQQAAGATAVQGEIATDEATAAPAAKPATRPWPKEAPAQARALADLLAESPTALSLADIGARFSARGRWRERLEPLLDMLVVLGRAQADRSRQPVRFRRAD